MADIGTWAAVAASVGILAVGWVVYDVLCRLLVRSELALSAAILLCTVGLAYGSENLFSPRGAYIQVGSTLGTIMAANVFFVIIPAHWELVRAKKGGREPDPAPGLKAKQRSVHNNYLTLPVVFTMISNHFPMTYGHDFAWAVLVALMVVGAWVRHYFNLRHTGRNAWAIPATAAAAIAGIAVWIAPPGSNDAPAAPPPAGALEAGKAAFSANCGSCHVLADAGATGVVGPNLDAAKPSRDLVLQRVENGQGVMPPFKGTLSDEAIASLADYVASVAGR